MSLLDPVNEKELIAEAKKQLMEGKTVQEILKDYEIEVTFKFVKKDPK